MMLSEDKSNLEKAQIQKNNNSLKVINDIIIYFIARRL